MRQILDEIERRKREVDGHPLYRWIRGSAAPLEDRLVFAPQLVSFVMAFSDMNKWFMRYPSPRDEYERGINRHTYEDETHSKLFLEDWRKLGFDGRLGWSASDTIQWYFASKETEILRGFGMEIMEMCVSNEDPLVRFALIGAIEACGHVFFTATAEVAAEMQAKTGQEYRYFGAHHLKRETGHVHTGVPIFEEAELDGAQRSKALKVVNRIFDTFLIENDCMLRYAEAALRGREAAPEGGERAAPGRGGPPGEMHRTEAPSDSARLRVLQVRKARQARQARSAIDARHAETMAKGSAQRAHAEVQRVLDARRSKTERHDFFRWMGEENGLPAEEKLRSFVPLWVPDVMGYKDLNRYALTYADPADRRERAINRWTADLESHHRLFLRDWAELGMDELVGWTAGETLGFYGLSKHTELQRRNMATFVKLAYAHPDPVLRYWLIAALEASGEAFFEGTRGLAARVEAEAGRRLDYFADRHHAAHPAKAPDAEADAVVFECEELGSEGRDIAITMIHTVFDGIDEQYSLSLDRSTRNSFAASAGVNLRSQKRRETG